MKVNNIRVAAYCRVSTEQDEQLNSLENQKIFFKNYIEKNPNWEFTDLYVDRGITGTNTKKRTGFNNMMNDAENKRFDLVITKEISRFARNTLDSIFYTRKLKALGIGVFFMNDNINTLDSDAELRLTIMSSIAQEESRKISERTKWGKKRSMERGVVMGSSVFGYFLKDGTLTVNPEEAKTVRLIYDLYLNKAMGSHLIANELANRGISSPYGLSRWQETTIIKLLKNEKYMGTLKQRKEITVNYLTHEKVKNNGIEDFIIIENHHEPIIDKETFEAVQKEIARRSIAAKEKHRHSSRYVWSGKIICGNCGKHYKRKVANRKGKNPKTVWGCQNYMKFGVEKINSNGEKTGCSSKYIREDVLEQSFMYVLKHAVKNKENIIMEIRRIINRVIENHDSDGKSISQLENDMARAERKKDKLIELFTDSVISWEEFERSYESCTGQLESLKKSLKKIKAESASKHNIAGRMASIDKAVEGMVKAENFSEEICRRTLEKIVVSSREGLTFYLKADRENNSFFIPLCVPHTHER